MFNNRPVRVFTEVSRTPKVHLEDNLLSQKNEMQEVSGLVERQINVTGVGELNLPPDRFSITIKCKSSKENVQDAKNSVTRRVDYIVQTLKNYSLKETDYKIYQHVYHLDSMANVDCDIEAHFVDVNKCQSVSNLLAEKLGPGVTVTMPSCYHARGSLDKLRKQVGMLAIHNARQKAMEMARILHLSVGNPLQVQELETKETQGVEGNIQEDPDLGQTIQQRIADATFLVSSRVSVCFQLKPQKSKKATKLLH